METFRSVVAQPSAHPARPTGAVQGFRVLLFNGKGALRRSIPRGDRALFHVSCVCQFLCYDVSYMALSKKKKTTLIKSSARHDSDTGSPEVQVTVLSKRIDDLSKHLKKNRKDKHSRRGLLGMVAKRRTHMDYLKKKNPAVHADLTKKIKE